MQKQQIHFVTGKGGVGKSFFAAALAESLAKMSQYSPQENVTSKTISKPILLAEFNDHSFYREYLGDKPAYFDLAQWTGAECLKEYAIHLLKIESLYKLFFGNPITRALIDVSPGLLELAILGRATSYPRKHGPPLKYTHMVFDAFATGHFLTMLRAPGGLAKIIQFGPMGEQTRSIDQWIRNPEFCHIHLVSLPEEMPATETVELFETIKSEFGITPKVYLNKYLFLKKADLANEPESVKIYFTNLLEQQELAEQIFKDHKIKYVPVPLIPEIETEKLLHEASEYLLKEVL
ncbi:arsenical pump-driving ATPase [Bdellovibrio sp. qaytius]|nr:arsenical pump-driving ATPase [Bdellovibrio sp. qaytius]